MFTGKRSGRRSASSVLHTFGVLSISVKPTALKDRTGGVSKHFLKRLAACALSDTNYTGVLSQNMLQDLVWLPDTHIIWPPFKGTANTS